MPVAEKKRSLPELSTDTRMLAAYLVAHADGQLVTYSELSEHIGRDVRSRARGNLTGAINTVLRDNDLVFATVRGEGIKRLLDGEVAAAEDGTVRRIHRAAHKGVKRLGAVQPANLNNEQRMEFNLKASHLGLLRKITDSKSTKRLESAVRSASQELPIARSLEALK